MKKDKPFVFRTETNMFKELQEQAEKDGISLNSWMNMKLRKLIREKKNGK